jgi:tRNA(fMet)-specific endonuclease VapC
LRRNGTVARKLRNANRSGQEVFINCITYYEVKRGLLYANATRQLEEFNQFYRKYEVLFLDDIDILETVCKIHLDLKQKGLSI